MACAVPAFDLAANGLEASSTFDITPLRRALRELVPFGWMRSDLTIALAGEIRHTGAVTDLVAWLAQAGKTSTIIVANAGGMRAVMLERGALRGAATTHAHERIGGLLQRDGTIPAEELDDASVMAAIDGRPLGELLVESGRISSPDLEELLRKRAEEIFYAACDTSDGAFFVIDQPLGSPVIPGEPMPLMNLLLEAARRSDEAERDRKSGPPPVAPADSDPPPPRKSIRRRRQDRANSI